MGPGKSLRPRDQNFRDITGAARAVLRADDWGEVDPNKWHLDQETGEYKRILYESSDGSLLLDKSSYSDRKTKALLNARDANKCRTYFLVCWPLLCVLFIFYRLGFDPAGFVAIFVAIGTAGCGIGWMFGAVVMNEIVQSKLGPAPVPPPGREEVERQKVHGEGRFATDEEIDAAARGANSAHGDTERFED